MKNYIRYSMLCGSLLLLILITMISGCTSQPVSNQEKVSSGTQIEEIQISNFQFSPETIIIFPGTTIKWINDDGTVHRIVSDPDAVITFDSGDLNKGDTFSITANERGNIGYHCSIHPEMTGTIIVQT